MESMEGHHKEATAQTNTATHLKFAKDHLDTSQHNWENVLWTKIIVWEEHTALCMV